MLVVEDSLPIIGQASLPLYQIQEMRLQHTKNEKKEEKKEREK